MLIYNHQKEFLGISEADLSILGFSNLSQLRSESSDFANLFVKTPGFVHNFKHVHWIDFVICAENSDDSKVIIQANGKNFKCILDIEVSYLIDEPSQKAYFVNLINLKELSQNENNKISSVKVQRSAKKESSSLHDDFEVPQLDMEAEVAEPAPIREEPKVQEEVRYEPASPAPAIEVQNTVDDTPLDLADFDDFDTDFSELNDIDMDTTEEVVVSPTPTPVASRPVAKPKPVAQAVVQAEVTMYVEALNAGLDYVYDPQVASDELGLPVDLIEEFIEDFIAQAYEFKDELFKSLDDNDIDNVKILSHKLKGVAANLRIEDAFEVLATINTSEDNDEIMRNMNTLYLIIDKLDGKEVAIAQPIAEEIVSQELSDDDDFIIDFKSDDEPSEVQEHIEVIDDLTIEPEEDLLSEFELPDLNLSFDDEPSEDISIDDINSTTYNKNSVAKDIGLDSASFDELFDDYVQEGQDACRKIKSAISQADAKLWKHDAIIFKGMSDNMRVDDFKMEIESIINTTDATQAQNAIDIIDARLKQLAQMEG